MSSRGLACRALALSLAVAAGAAWAEREASPAVSRGPDGVRLRLRPQCTEARSGAFLLHEVRVEGIIPAGEEHTVVLERLRVGARTLPVDSLEVVDRRDPSPGMLVGGAPADPPRAVLRSRRRTTEVYILARPSAPAQVALDQHVEVVLLVDGHRHRLVGSLTICFSLIGDGDPEATAPAWDF